MMAKRKVSAKELVEQYGSDAWSIGSAIADIYPNKTEKNIIETNQKVFVRQRKTLDRFGEPIFEWAYIPKKMLAAFLEGFRWMRE